MYAKVYDVLIVGKMNVEQHNTRKIHKALKVVLWYFTLDSSLNFKDFCHGNLLVKINYFLSFFW
jgi:hypothetical protein